MMNGDPWGRGEPQREEGGIIGVIGKRGNRLQSPRVEDADQAESRTKSALI